MTAVLTWTFIKYTQRHTAVIAVTWRDIKTRVWQVLVSGRDFVVRHSAHVESDLIKKLLMVTVFYRDNVYVEITALNGCDIQHLAVTFLLMEQALFPKVGT